MKRNEDFLLRDVAGSLVIVPVGAAVTTFPGMITLNATAAFLWELLEKEQTVDTLVAGLMDRYDVEEARAREDVIAFVERLQPTGALV